MTQEQLSEILDNILGLLLLEGSYELEESEEGFHVFIQTKDAGRIIGYRGEALQSLQLIVSQIATQKSKEFKRVIVDVEGWRKNKEGDLAKRAEEWASQVKESQKPMELEPMPSWQRRAVHLKIQEMQGVESESVGEGSERHLVIKPAKSD
ncbi:KH domain-containing protein [Candidatus Daviesbacteria bacterium]|nr:KH domain-containing protein [Candidatus Daviesbacteria bacterium]